MSGLSVGLSTFASCNKAGSIPHFTRHLQSYPKDFEALMWRGRAYSIIGQMSEALADFRSAETHSVGPQKYLAESMMAFTKGHGQKSMEALSKAVKAYPKCGEVWSEIGYQQFSANAHADALPTLKEAIDLGKKNSETHRPWYYWSNKHIGDIYYEMHQVPNAELYYNTAVTSCNTFTVAHLGISKCNIINKKIPEAKTRFQTAKGLNPILVHWGNFAEFEQDVVSDFYKLNISSSQRNHDEATSSMESQFSKVAISNNNAAKGYSASNRGAGARQDGDGSNGGGNKGGGGGNGGGNGGDDDVYVWKKFRQTSKRTLQHSGDGRQFKRIGSSPYWLSRVKGKPHAEGFFKVYFEKRKTINFIGSVPIRIFYENVVKNKPYLLRILHESPELEDFKFIKKHESHVDEIIKKTDLHVVYSA